MNYQSTIDTIESIMDDAAKSAAQVFLTDARKNLAPLNLSRHRIQFELSDMVVHAVRADNRPDTSYWYEVTGTEPADQAIRALGRAHNQLPKDIRRHLAGQFLEIP
jgi:hypothetical protein